MTTEEVLRRCKATLSGHYGRQFRGLVLYGSLARGQGDEASDIDLLVLLDAPFDYFQELRRIVDLLYPLQLESTRLISALPALADEFEVGTKQLYRVAQHEGVPL